MVEWKLLSMDFWCNMCRKLQTLVLTNFEDFLNDRNIGQTCNVAFLFGQELVQEKKGLTCKFIKSFKTNYFFLAESHYLCY